MSCTKSRLLPIAFAVTICQFVSLAQVQNGPNSSVALEIHGQVRFAAGGAPAQNILVRLESYDGGGPLAEAFTDRLGKFQFTGLAPAQYAVRIHESGYVDAQQRVDLQTASSGYVMLQLLKESPNGVSSTAGRIDANVPQAAQKEFEKGIVDVADGSKERLQRGVGHLEKAIAIYPNFVEARLKLGTAYMDLEQWDQAERMLRATVDLDPKAANALFALGEVYLQQNKLAEAEKVLDQGMKIEDRSYFGHLNLARVYWIRSNNTKDLQTAKPLLEKSYEEVKRALELNSQLAGAHLLKGNLLLRAGRAADALKEFDEYLRIEPKGQTADQTRELMERIRKATAGPDARRYSGWN